MTDDPENSERHSLKFGHLTVQGVCYATFQHADCKEPFLMVINEYVNATV